MSRILRQHACPLRRIGRGRWVQVLRFSAPTKMKHPLGGSCGRIFANVGVVILVVLAWSGSVLGGDLRLANRDEVIPLRGTVVAGPGRQLVLAVGIRPAEAAARAVL